MLESLDSQLKNYRSCQIVLKEGRPVYRMGILLEGSLTISDVSFWGTLTPIEEIQPGMIFAEDLAQTRGAIADERIEAVTASIVLWVGLSEILKLDGSQPWHTIVIRNLMNQFARRSSVRRYLCSAQRPPRSAASFRGSSFITVPLPLTFPIRGQKWQNILPWTVPPFPLKSPGLPETDGSAVTIITLS